MNFSRLFFLLLFCLIIFESCSPKTGAIILERQGLVIEQLSPSTWTHWSYLDTESYGKVRSNGMVYIQNGEAIVFDTPANLVATEALINWLENEKKVLIKAVVAGHFHEDCLLGLPLFHQKGISSYGQEQTPALAAGIGFTSPQSIFGQEKILDIGGQQVHLFYPGPGHTVDNIVGYVPSEKALFGGCLVKSIGAGKGNLADANIEKWSSSVKAVQDHFPEVKYIVPGHGRSGDATLLDFTINLFK